MAQLTVQKIVKTGLNPAFVAAGAGGDSFNNVDKTFLVVKNGDVASKTVTIDSKVNCNQGFDHNLSIDVPAGEERWIGFYERERFTGTVEVTYSDITSVTVAAVQI